MKCTKLEEYLKSVNKFSESKLCGEMREYALENNYPIINQEGLKFLSQIVKLSNVKNVLEIGTAIGYSSISLAELGCNVTTIEINEDSYNIAKSNISLYNGEGVITPILNDALEINIKELEKEYDLIFIDAAKAQYIKFFDKFTPLLKKGGIVFTDNLTFHNLVVEEIKNKNLRQLVGKVKRFNDFIVEKEGYDSYIYNTGDGICISIKE